MSAPLYSSLCKELYEKEFVQGSISEPNK